MLVVGAFVAGFAPTPSDDLTGRSIAKATELCDKKACVLAGPNPKKLKGKCVGIGYKNNDPRAKPFPMDLEAIDEGWCYQSAGGPTTCEYYRRGCVQDNTPAFCEQYQKATQENEYGIVTCPPQPELEIDEFCPQELPKLKKLPEGVWCGTIKDEDTCEESVYQGKGEGPQGTSTIGTTMYGRCIWDKDKCVKKRRPGYDEVYFCQNSCKVLDDREELPVGTKCGKGPTFEEPRDRLYSAEVCESYFSKVEVQGLPDILYPCVAQQPGGMRDEVQQACFQKCKDENPANPCTTACNCVESTRVKEWAASEWKNVPGCAGEEMQCCRETKDGYTCVNCED